MPRQRHATGRSLAATSARMATSARHASASPPARARRLPGEVGSEGEPRHRDVRLGPAARCSVRRRGGGSVRGLAARERSIRDARLEARRSSFSRPPPSPRPAREHLADARIESAVGDVARHEAGRDGDGGDETTRHQPRPVVGLHGREASRSPRRAGRRSSSTTSARRRGAPAGAAPRASRWAGARSAARGRPRPARPSSPWPSPCARSHGRRPRASRPAATARASRATSTPRAPPPASATRVPSGAS